MRYHQLKPFLPHQRIEFITSCSLSNMHIKVIVVIERNIFGFNFFDGKIDVNVIPSTPIVLT